MTEFHISDKGILLDDELENIERQWIRKALEKSRGSKIKAAELLHITADALRKRIKKLKIEEDQ